MPFLRTAIVRKASDGQGHWLGGLAVDHCATWTGPRMNLPLKGKMSPDMRLVFPHAWEVVVNISILRQMADSCRQCAPRARRTLAGVATSRSRFAVSIVLESCKRTVVRARTSWRDFAQDRRKERLPRTAAPSQPRSKILVGAGGLDIGPFATKVAA